VLNPYRAQLSRAQCRRVIEDRAVPAPLLDEIRNQAAAAGWIEAVAYAPTKGDAEVDPAPFFRASTKP